MADPAGPREQPEGSLVFESKEVADAFAERVRRRVETGEVPAGPEAERRAREAIREELAETTKRVAPPGTTEQVGAWQPTDRDRAEVQRYVNLAFETTVEDAVKALAARRGDDAASVYRTLDLFHDTLTDHLYDTLVERGLLHAHRGR